MIYKMPLKNFKNCSSKSLKKKCKNNAEKSILYEKSINNKIKCLK